MWNGGYHLLVQAQEKKEVLRVLNCNDKSEEFGLSLTQEEAKELMVCRRETLKEQRRVEFGEGILPQLIEAFCDSQYIEQAEYVATLEELQSIFYLYKNESADMLTDEELITFMREQFEGVCYGSVEYLSETCLARFAQGIRGGNREYTKSKQGDEYGTNAREGAYERLSEETHWDRELYFDALEKLND